MSTDIDELIGAEVERSFAAEPAPRDPRQYAARGRRAQRLRRMRAGALGVTGMAVVAALALGGTDGTTPSRGVEPAVSGAVPLRGSAPVAVDPRQAEKCSAGRVGACDAEIGNDDIRLDRFGGLVRGYEEDVVTGYYTDVLPHVPDPDVTVGSSAAVELTVQGRTVWALLRRDVGTRGSSLQYAAPDPTRSFDEWVHDSIASGHWFSYRRDPDGPGEGSTPR